MALWAPLIAIMIWMSGNFFELQKEIANVRIEITESEKRVSAKIQELDDRIVALDNKFNTIGTMTVVAYRDGEITPDELAAMWESATSPD